MSPTACLLCFTPLPFANLLPRPRCRAAGRRGRLARPPSGDAPRPARRVLPSRRVPRHSGPPLPWCVGTCPFAGGRARAGMCCGGWRQAQVGSACGERRCWAPAPLCAGRPALPCRPTPPAGPPSYLLCLIRALHGLRTQARASGTHVRSKHCSQPGLCALPVELVRGARRGCSSGPLMVFLLPLHPDCRCAAAACTPRCPACCSCAARAAAPSPSCCRSTAAPSCCRSRRPATAPSTRRAALPFSAEAQQPLRGCTLPGGLAAVLAALAMPC